MPLTPEPKYHNPIVGETGFDRSKRFFEVRARAGYAEQSREDNEIQAILLDVVQRYGDILFKPSSVVKGGTYTKGLTTLTMNEATFYHEGILHEVEARALPWTQNGTEVVGIKVTETLVTADDVLPPDAVYDASLKDPAVGDYNYGRPGANRKRIVCTWEIDNDDAVPVLTFDGGVAREEVDNVIDPIEEAVAQRIHEIEGNFRVNGYDLGAQAVGTDTHFAITVLSGGSTAYVRGKKIHKTRNEALVVPKATQTRLVEEERKTYAPVNPASPTELERTKALKNTPVAKIEQAFATYDVFRTVTNHATVDAIPLNAGETLVKVLRVYADATQGNVDNPSTVFAEAANVAGPGAWYVPDNADTLRWDVSGQSVSSYGAGNTYAVNVIVSYSGLYYQSLVSGNVGNQPNISPTKWRAVSLTGPALAGSYHVYMTIRRAMVENTDFVLENDALVIPSGATKPYAYNKIWDDTMVSALGITSSDIDIDYSFSLSRVDVVYLDGSGEIKVQEGTYDVNPLPPAIDGDVLALGEIKVVAGSAVDPASYVVTQYDNQRLTALELRDLKNRVDRTEYNLALADLDNDGLRRSSNGAATLSGILTEGFAYASDDFTSNKQRFVRELTTENGIDVFEREFTLPHTKTPMDLVPNGAYEGGRWFTVDSVGTFEPQDRKGNIIRQLRKTGSIPINIFDDYKEPPTVELDVPTGGRVLNDVTTLNLLAPTSPRTVATSIDADRAASTTGQQRQTQLVTSGRIYDFMRPTWRWIKGTGFPANAQVLIRVSGRAPALSLGSNGTGAGIDNTAWPTARWGAWPSGTTIVKQNGSAAVTATVTLTEPGRSYSSGVYTGQTEVVKTDASGNFGVAILIPEGTPAGTAEVVAQVMSVSSVAEERAAAFYEAKSLLTLNVVGQPPDPPPAPPAPPALPAPVITQQVLNADTNAVLGNFTGTVNAKVRLSWTQGSTPPSTVSMTLTRTTGAGAPVALTFTRGVADPAGYTANWMPDNNSYVDITGGVLTGLTGTGINVSSTGGVTGVNPLPPVRTTVTNNGAAPVFTPVTITNLVVTGAGPRQTLTVHKSSAVTSIQVTVIRSGWTIFTTTASVTDTSAPTQQIEITLASFDNDIQVAAIGANDRFATGLSVFVPPPSRDPLAQTFRTGATDLFVKAVKVSFAARPIEAQPGGATDVTAELRQVIAGVPGAKLIQAKKLTYAEIAAVSLGSDVSFEFDTPAYLRAEREYAIVLKTPNPAYTVHVAKVGQVELAGSPAAGTKLAHQAYADGVLLQSANDSAWSPVGNTDLYFKLECHKYSSATKEVNFNVLSPANAVGFRLDPGPGTFIPGHPKVQGQTTGEIRWQYSVDGGTKWTYFEPHANIYFAPAAVSNSLKIKAELTSRGDEVTPVVSRALALNVITRGTSSRLVSKTMTVTTAYRYVRMIAKMALPTGNVSADWYISENTAAGAVTAHSPGTYAKNALVTYQDKTWVSLVNSNGTTPSQGANWSEASTENEDGVIWRLVPAAGGTQTLLADNVFTEHERTIDLGVDANRKQFRFMIKAKANAVADTATPPRVKDIIAIVNS